VKFQELNWALVNKKTMSDEEDDQASNSNIVDLLDEILEGKHRVAWLLVDGKELAV
jgi:hypothetical protein